MNLVRDTTITVAGRLFSTGVAALTAVLVAHTLGAKGAGTFALVRVIPTVLAGLLSAGVTTANAYLVGGRRYPVQKIAETTTAIALVLGLVGWAGWIAFGDLLHARFYRELSPPMVTVTGLLVPLMILRDYLNSIQQGLRTFKGANLVLCLDDVVTLFLLIPLLAGVGDGNLIVLATAAGVASSCLLATALLLRQGIRPWPWPHRDIAGEAIRFGLKSHVGRIADLLNWRLDIMILSTMASVEMVGYYAVATKVAELLRPVSASLTFVFRPLVASLPLHEARAQGLVLYRRFFALNLGGVVVLAVVGGPLILTFFGPDFAASVPAFQILLIGLAAHGADGVLSGYNVGVGRPEFNSYTALIALVVTVIGDVIMIPLYGLIGAAIVSSVAYTVKAAVLATIFLFTADIRISELLGVKEYSPDLA
jgi:O-antigen/teichoic acid export membrane protein